MAVSFEVVLDVDGTEQKHSFTCDQQRELMDFWKSVDATGAVNGKAVFAGYCWQYGDDGERCLLHKFEA